MKGVVNIKIKESNIAGALCKDFFATGEPNIDFLVIGVLLHKEILTDFKHLFSLKVASSPL